MPLTDVKIRNTKPSSKQLKLFDGGGLFLLVAPSGGRLWRLKYRFSGKEKLLAIGPYPEVTLSEARQRRDEARKLLANGVDPGEAKKARKASAASAAEESFEAIAREWHTKFTPTWSAGHTANNMIRLEKDVFPFIGGHPINNIRAPELLAVLRRVEARGALEMAHRIRTICGQVFRYAVATGRAERDPASDLRGALPSVKKKRMAAITDPGRVGGLLRAMDGYEGSFIVKCAMRLAPLVFLRPGELRHAEWAEIDFDRAEWNLPAEKMKMKEPHLVPLSKQALAILREIEPLTGTSRYVFPGGRSVARPLSNNAINAALRRMGFSKEEMTAHGFRAMARTLLDEVLHVRPDFIEHQLAHAVRDPLGRAYNRTSHLEERRKMMQQWADYLDKLRSGATP